MKYLKLNLKNEKDADFILLLKLFFANIKTILFFAVSSLILSLFYNYFFISYNYNNKIFIHKNDLNHTNLDSFMVDTISNEKLVSENFALYIRNSITNKSELGTNLNSLKSIITSDPGFKFDSYQDFINHLYSNFRITSDGKSKLIELSYNSPLQKENIKLIFDEIMNVSNKEILLDILQKTNFALKGEKVSRLLVEKNLLKIMLNNKKEQKEKILRIESHLASAKKLNIYEPLVDFNLYDFDQNFQDEMNFLIGEKYLTVIYNEEQTHALEKIDQNITNQKILISRLEDLNESNSINITSSYKRNQLSTFLYLLNNEILVYNNLSKVNFFNYNINDLERNPNFRNPNYISIFFFIFGIIVGLTYIFLSNEIRIKNQKFIKN